MALLVWLVTGCSSGFGEQFVHNILARGDKVIASGRNAATKLKHLEGTGAAILDLDVSIPPAEINAKVEEALKIYGTVDVLVNNAGYIESAPVEELTYVSPFLRSNVAVAHEIPGHLVLAIRRDNKLAYTVKDV